MNLLLHSCCAPCLTHPLNELQKDFDTTVFFYNPNIHPSAEYEMRLKEAQKYLTGKADIIIGDYEVALWCKLIRGHENDPERGERCKICYEMRLAKTAETGAKLGFSTFTTTLSISPHKNATWLNEIGARMEKKFNIKYLPADWKKQDGFKKSLEISRAAGLRRQNYCGCIYSKNPK
jgi:epoxyqueuosine reductase